MKRPSLFQRLPGAYARRMAKWFGRRPFTMKSGGPAITFTFDDFPRSALSIGGTVLEQGGAKGTYFTSHGLMGQNTPTGEIFQSTDLPEVLARGHELGCHTYDHFPAWTTPTELYESSVRKNAASLANLPRLSPLQTHSFPISYPRPATKRRLGRYFRGCRGGGQTFNVGTLDLNYLNSFFLEQSRDDIGPVERAIAANTAAGGWLIFSTHDIASVPTRFGCTPHFFEAVVRLAAASGARLVPMSTALDLIGVARLSSAP